MTNKEVSDWNFQWKFWERLIVPVEHTLQDGLLAKEIKVHFFYFGSSWVIH